MLVIMVVVVILVLEVPEVVVVVVVVVFCWINGGDGESGVCGMETCHIATCDTVMKKKKLTKMIKKRLKIFEIESDIIIIIILPVPATRHGCGFFQGWYLPTCTCTCMTHTNDIPYH